MHRAVKILLLNLIVVGGLWPFFILKGYAQDPSDSSLVHRKYPFRIHATAGTSLYFGDIRTFDYQPVFKPYSELQPVYGLSLERRVHSLLALSLGYMGGNLSGVQKTFSDGTPANLRFNGKFNLLALSLGVNISELFYGKNEFRRLILEGYAGGGMLFYRSELTNYNSGILIDSEGYTASGNRASPSSSFILPAGLRVTYALNNKFDLSLSAGYTLVFSDRLDAKERSAPYDGFFSTTAGVSYAFLRPKKKQRKPVPEPVEKQEIKADLVSNPEKPETVLPEKTIQDSVPETEEAQSSEPAPSPQESQKPEVREIIEISAIPEPEKTTVKEEGKRDTEPEAPRERVAETRRSKGKSEKLALVPEETKDAGFGFLPLVPQLPPEEVIKEETPPGLEYRVQIMSTYMRRIPLNDLVLKYQLNQSVKEYYNNGWYQYTAGSFKTQTEAARYKEQLAIENGISDAFVVIFKEGNRFYQGKRKSMSFSVVGEENVRFPKPDLEENLSFDNVEFRVQVAAFTDRKVSPEKIRERLKLEETVRLDSIRNRYYYSIGSFSNLRQAREYCKLIISRNFVYDAFVIAYVDGVRKTLSEITTKVSPEGEKKIETKPGIQFKVQLIALKDKQLTAGSFKDQYNLREHVEIEERNGFQVYTSGNFKTYEDAMKLQTKMRQSGFPDAFIVAYRSGKRIALKEALIEF